MSATLTTSTRPPVRAGSRALPVSIAAVVVVLPFADLSVPVIGMRLVYVAMAVPGFLAFRALAREDVRLPASLIFVGAGLGMAGGTVSAALGVDPARSIPLVVISVLTLGYATAIVIAYRPGLEVVGPELLVAVGGVIAVMALTSAGSLSATDAGTVVTGRLTGPFSQPNELGMFCAVLLPMAVACLVTAATPRRAALIGLAAAAIAAACVMSMSRGAWIGATVALVALAICEPATRRALTAVGLTIAATCAAALTVSSSAPVLGIIGQRIRSIGDPTQNEYDDRPLTWAEAWRQATEHPWFGVGPGGFKSAAADSSSAVSLDPADHPHDLFLTVLADRGVVGVALGVLVVVGCIVAVRRHLLVAPGFDGADRVLRTRSVAVIAARTVVAVHGAFDMPLRNPIVSGLVWTVLGMAMVTETCRLREERAVATRKRVS